MESKHVNWLAASLDAIVTMKSTTDDLQVAVVEVKTSVPLEKIAEANRTAKKYQNNIIFCHIDDETWKACVEQKCSNK
jgi:hypothetical protein